MHLTALLIDIFAMSLAIWLCIALMFASDRTAQIVIAGALLGMTGMLAWVARQIWHYAPVSPEREAAEKQN